LESVLYGHIVFEPEGVVVIGGKKDQRAVAQFRSLVEGRADIAGSPRDDQTRLAGSSEREGAATTPTNPSIAALEQRLCLLLGVSCMVCGVWGICMKYSQGLSSGYVPWLGSAYGPALRLTALACLAFGAVLVRLGLQALAGHRTLTTAKFCHLSAGTAGAMQKCLPLGGRF
jgi:hypothetical protein